MRRTQTIATDDLQGPGSFVTLRTMSRGERRALGALALPEDATTEAPGAAERVAAAVALGDATICACLVAWNWKAADGTALPCPPPPADLDQLSDEERQFLFEQLYAVSFPTEAEKNA